MTQAIFGRGMVLVGIGMILLKLDASHLLVGCYGVVGILHVISYIVRTIIEMERP